ncbi:hypothetical protein JNB88_31300 [Rhizobium cauense]|uniref:hypothetical protein n=1 Tax=Rhizobium cauense TaxID=1166683 RepID=UPI001C6E1AA7|nr:hypothetical protein [Rhizobium cauense]MBW9118102.1 hypothetical protein [Rhizobium cauense]
MAIEKKLVEVTVKADGGARIPLGIMNTQQAISLPDGLPVEVSHPDHEPGTTDVFIDKDELKRQSL